MPDHVHRRLDAAGLNHRPVLLSVGTDVGLAGEPAAEWLVVTPDHLAATDGHDTLRAVAWRSVERVRTTSGVGGGSLQVRTDGVWIDLVRYSNALATRFHKISRALDRSASGLRPGCPGNWTASMGRSTRPPARRAASGSRPRKTPARAAFRRGRSFGESANSWPPTPAAR